MRPPPPRPAYSAQFTPERLATLDPVLPVDAITSEWAWGGSTGKGIKVAILDSGIDAQHAAVDGRVAGYVGITEGPDGPVFDTEPHEDAYGHGTACAGIIRTVAPDCELYSIKILGAGLSGRGSVFITGLRWAIQNGMRVCNLSLGTTKRDFFAVLHELADMAYFHNVMLVTAANNMPFPSFPSVFASVIAVASHDLKDPYVFYYNPKPPVEFGAPGVDVRLAWLNGSWIVGTGNSYAAPHITGLVTKILAKHPDLTGFQMKTVLRALATNTARPT
ncbi:MAG: S8 family serine peptidase [Chloroflexi bacterium]|nr:S8 family serine peptidase [Chloroflexota bacterium]